MKKIFVLLVILIAGFLGWVGVQNAQRGDQPSEPVYYVTEQGSEKAKADYTNVRSADEMLGSLVDNAKKHHPDQSTSVGMQKEAISAIDQFMDNAQGEEERLMTAASAFFGAYHVNVTSRAAFCNKHGVDISPFVTLFKQKNTEEYQRSLAVLKSNGYTVEALSREIGPQLARATEIDMNDVAKAVGGDLPAACEFMNDRKELMVREISFQKRMPEAYDVLMGLE